MLNCTDLACVLHHHHFYAHLHQLKHHLQDDNENTALGDGSDLDNNDNTQTITNDVDPELSSLSHVDAANDVIYMICGVVIAMLLVGLIIILVAVTINKLRKREESSSGSPTAVATIEAQQSNIGPASLSSSSGNTYELQLQQQHHQQQQQQQQLIFNTSSLVECNNASNNNNHISFDQEQVTFTRTSGGGNGVTATTATNNGWVFPPKAPTPNIYNCITNDVLLAANDKNGFKGFRKQFSGRFKRLVAKKSENSSAIPPELKPQLKTIYVY